MKFGVVRHDFVLSALLGVVLAVACLACDGSGKSKVLARVDGKAITRAEFDRAVGRVLGPQGGSLLSADAKQKMLEGLVLNHVMANALHKELDREALRELDAEIADYRVSLMAQLYVRKNAGEIDVSEKALRAYYDAHPENYGKATVRRFEMLKGYTEENQAKQERMLAVLGEAAKAKPASLDWSAYAKRENVRNAGVTFYRGPLTPGLFSSKLESVIRELGEGETSAVVVVDHVPHLVRVTAIEEVAAKPFSEVRDQVVEQVRAVKTKEAVAALRAEILSQAKVKYTEDAFAE